MRIFMKLIWVIQRSLRGINNWKFYKNFASYDEAKIELTMLNKKRVFIFFKRYS